MSSVIFRHAAVRDLAWAGFAPQLIKTADIQGAGLDFSDFWRSLLPLLDADPAPLTEFLEQRESGRLGLYYEALWQFLLTHDPDIELIAHNYPVRDGGQTVGEFDCLYWSRRERRHIHLELAVKFYLGVPDRHIWLGPGRRDRLDQKLVRLVGHQSRLSDHPAAREALATLGIDHCERRIDIKGYLFAPPVGMAPPAGYNPQSPLQRWYSLSEFKELPALDPDWTGWQKIPRRRWLSPFAVDRGELRSVDELLAMLQQRLEDSGRPVQIAACDEDGRERYRCFVTPDHWP
jgi:hypothetical protein